MLGRKKFGSARHVIYKLCLIWDEEGLLERIVGQGLGGRGPSLFVQNSPTIPPLSCRTSIPGATARGAGAGPTASGAGGPRDRAERWWCHETRRIQGRFRRRLINSRRRSEGCETAIRHDVELRRSYRSLFLRQVFSLKKCCVGTTVVLLMRFFSGQPGSIGAIFRKS